MGHTQAPTISRTVQAQLDERGISGAELARRLGFTQSYVARRIRGEVPWRADDIALIARELEIDAAELLAPGRAA